MTEHEAIGMIRDSLADIRTEVRALRADVSSIKNGGCMVGAANKTRLDELDKRSAVAGGGAGAVAAIVVAVVNFFLRRNGQ